MTRVMSTGCAVSKLWKSVWKLLKTVERRGFALEGLGKGGRILSLFRGEKLDK